MKLTEAQRDLEQADFARILMIFFSCYDIPPQDKKILSKSLSKENYRTVLDNLRYVETQKRKHAKQLKRIKDIFTKEDFNEYKRRSASYQTLRQVP